MQFKAWEPIYLEIIKDFGFSRERDDEAALLLSSMLKSLYQESTQSLEAASNLVRGSAVVVCGNAPSMASEFEKLAGEDKIFIAADGATSVFMTRGKVPDIIATDLDGPFDDILKANRMGAIVVVHAHGDNLDALRRHVPELKKVIGTTQSKPLDEVYNFGGFTDGDRCVFLAKDLGAAEIRLIGFDYDDPTVTPRKRKKLAWARRLIDMALSLGSNDSP